MSVSVNPPPQLKFPRKIQQDNELWPFFRDQQQILFQLWNRTGGNRDAVASELIILASSSDFTLDQFGTLTLVDAGDEQIDIVLPIITNETIGETVAFTLVDDTNNAVLTPQGSQTILGHTSLTMNEKWMSISLTAATDSLWVIA